MDYKVTKDDFYNNITIKLTQIVPDFSFDEQDEPYPIMFGFAQFVIDNINNEPVLIKCCKFINDAVLHGGSETETLIVLQVFQCLYYNTMYMERCKSHFSSDTAALFDKYYLEFLKDYDPDGVV